MNKTNIPWTDFSWNPWQGCKKISEGCKNCYMFRDKIKYGQDPYVIVRSKTVFDKPYHIDKPSLIFTCSWSDFFLEEADEWRDEAWEIIRKTPHTYQILTKRPDNILERLPSDWGDGYDNVWLGVSVELQKHVGRAYTLNQVPAKVRFVSAEPLLGPLDLEIYLTSSSPMSMLMTDGRGFHGIDWVIAGGESGSNYREMKIAWAEDLARQCFSAGVPFFMKQASGTKPGLQGDIPDSLWNRKEFPNGNED